MSFFLCIVIVCLWSSVKSGTDLNSQECKVITELNTCTIGVCSEHGWTYSFLLPLCRVRYHSCHRKSWGEQIMEAAGWRATSEPSVQVWNHGVFTRSSWSAFSFFASSTCMQGMMYLSLSLSFFTPKATSRFFFLVCEMHCMRNCFVVSIAHAPLLLSKYIMFVFWHVQNLTCKP